MAGIHRGGAAGCLQRPSEAGSRVDRTHQNRVRILWDCSFQRAFQEIGHQPPITQLTDYPITQLPNYPITRLPDYPILLLLHRECVERIACTDDDVLAPVEKISLRT